MAALVRPLPLNAERLCSHSTASSRQMATVSSRRCPIMATGVMRLQQRARRRLHQLHITSTYPTPETEKERSPIDFPQVFASRTCSIEDPPPRSPPLPPRLDPSFCCLPPARSCLSPPNYVSLVTGVDNAAAQQKAGHLPGVREAADTIAKANARRS